MKIAIRQSQKMNSRIAIIRQRIAQLGNILLPNDTVIIEHIVEKASWRYFKSTEKPRS